MRAPNLPYSYTVLLETPDYKYMRADEKLDAVSAWTFFEDIFIKNLRIKEKRQQEITEKGRSITGYYVFTSNTYKQMYKLGERLHVNVYPEYDWSIPYSDE
jgi:hypothetical protein